MVDGAAARRASVVARMGAASGVAINIAGYGSPLSRRQPGCRDVTQIRRTQIRRRPGPASEASAEPGPITTVANWARSWSGIGYSNKHRWLWVPAFASRSRGRRGFGACVRADYLLKCQTATVRTSNAVIESSVPLTAEYTFAIPRRVSPGVCCIFRPHRTEAIRPSLRNGFTGYNALSPVNGLLATVACGCCRKLDACVATSGPRDFAVRIGRSRQSHRPRPSHPAPRW